MKYEIRHRYSGHMLFALDCGSLRECVEAAVQKRVDIRGADFAEANFSWADLFSWADFSWADFTGADLTLADFAWAKLTEANFAEADFSWAYFRGADLTGACFTVADLTGADFRGATLTEADFTGANLTGADFSWADFTGATFTRAKLTGATFTRADLTGADFSQADFAGANIADADFSVIRQDVWSVLESSPAEVPALREAILAGKVDGSTYEGDCACLVGTLAKARNCRFDAIPGLDPNSDRPAERFFFAIAKGDTPETSQFSRLALQWVEKWLKRNAT